MPGPKLVKEFSKCSVEELKKWLECHGQKKIGKGLALFERVKRLLQLNVKVNPKVDGGH